MSTIIEIPEFKLHNYQNLEYLVLNDHNGETTYKVILKPDEDGRFVATCPDLQGVVTDGATEEEAMENIRYAINDMLNALGITNKEFNLAPIINF